MPVVTPGVARLTDPVGRPTRPEHRLGRSLTVAMILFSSLITTVITAIQLYTDYRSDIGRIGENFKFIRESYLNVLVDSVWTANDSQIQAQLEGLLRLRDMEYLAISVDGQPRWAAGARHSQRMIESDVALERIYRDKPVLIGRLAMVASEDQVLARIANRLLIVLGENMIKTLLVATFVLWLFRTRVTRHLDQIARFAEGVEAATLTGPPLRLVRPVAGHWRPDELDAVVQAFNSMRTKLSAAYDDLRKTTDQLAESERRLRVLMANVPGVIYRCQARPPYCLQLISDGVSRLSGHALSEFSGEHGLSWASLILPEDRAHVACEITAAAAEQRPYELEYRIAHADGSVRWISDYGRPSARLAGQAAWIDAVAVDISGRKAAELAWQQSERRLSLHVQQSMMGIIEWDTDLRVVEWNPAAESIFGYRREEAVGRHAKELILTPEVFPFVDAVWRDLLGRSGGTYSNNDNLTRDGRVITCDWLNTPLVGGEGRVIGVVSLVRDVSERKRAEAELRVYRDHLEELVALRTAELSAAKEEAEAANRAKSAFLANMSHELRTPMNAILGFSALLRHESGLGEFALEYLEIINRSGVHLLGLINDVLDMAKIEAGRTQLAIAPFDLGVLINDLLALIGQRAREKSLALQLEKSPDLPRHLRGDEARLRQVLVNLLGNAVKFTSRGTITLRVHGKPEAERYLLRVEVEDTGPGIAADDQARVFEPFEQAGLPSQQKGTGLGLAICRQFIELMGGRIGVSSLLGKGSRFWIELPLALPLLSDVVCERPDDAEVIGLQAGQPDWRILIVEDQPENALLLSRLLADVGFQVDRAENGHEAVERFRAWRPDFIWMDQRMPVMDGNEATRQIRGLEGGDAVKIVVLTASVFAQQSSELPDARIDGILYKPFEARQVFECMGRHLGVRYVFRQNECAEPASPDAGLDRAALAALPEQIRRRLADALIALDTRQIDALIGQIGERAPALGRALHKKSEEFDFEAIIQLLVSTKES